MTTYELWNKFQEELDFRPAKDFQFPEDWVNTFTPILETHNLATEIIKKYPVGILTNVFSGVYEIQMKNNLVPDLKYYSVIKSCDYGLVKPGKEIYKIAQQEAGADPSEILYTDDIKMNIESAKSLGWNTVWFDENNPKKSIKEILRLTSFAQDDI